MSLDVPSELLAKAENNAVTDEEFITCVRHSLPYAWQVISETATKAAVGPAFHETPPPSETDRGQLLRALASDAIRSALERTFGVTLAFQNCHRVAAFPADTAGGKTYQEFISPAGQLRNQSQSLRHC